MLFGFTGVELSLMIVAIALFSGILSGYPVAYAISGAAFVSFAVIAGLNEAGLLYTLQEHNGAMEKVPVLERGWQKSHALGRIDMGTRGFLAGFWRQCRDIACSAVVRAYGYCA